MTPKQKAIAVTIGMFICAFLVGYSIQYIAQNVSPELILSFLAFVFFAFMFNVIYQVFLMKFTQDEKTVDPK